MWYSEDAVPVRRFAIDPSTEKLRDLSMNTPSVATAPGDMPAASPQKMVELPEPVGQPPLACSGFVIC